jgi:hypothetical protein
MHEPSWHVVLSRKRFRARSQDAPCARDFSDARRGRRQSAEWLELEVREMETGKGKMEAVKPLWNEHVGTLEVEIAGANTEIYSKPKY